MEKKIILEDKGMIDALDVIKSHCFRDTTPEISLCTSKVFEREGKKYRFVGWHHPNTRPISGRTWEDVEMEEIA